MQNILQLGFLEKLFSENPITPSCYSEIKNEKNHYYFLLINKESLQ